MCCRCPSRPAGDTATTASSRAATSAAAFPQVDVAVLVAGAARTALFDGAPRTLTGRDVAEAVRRLATDRVVVHVDSWAHVSEDRDDVRAA